MTKTKLKKQWAASAKGFWFGACLAAAISACTLSTTGIETGGTDAVIPNDGGTAGTVGTGGTGEVGGSDGTGAMAGVPGMLPGGNTPLPPDKLAQGAACTMNKQCGTGLCIEGVCCDSTCTNGCVSCALPNLVGKCSPIAAGTAPRTENTCLKESANTCGLDGTCNGVGGCRSHVMGTACGQGSCSDAMETPPSTCDGSGKCIATAPRTCAPYICSTRACDTECRRNEDCSGNTQCLGKKCVITDVPVIKSTVSVPVIDGETDDIWNRSNAAWQTIPNVISGSVGSTADLTGRFKALWTTEAFYILVEIADSSLVNDSPEVWKDDAIEIYFDANNSRAQTFDNVDDLQYIFGLNDGDFSEGKMGKKQGVVFSTRTANDSKAYVFEAKFPWSTLGLTSPAAGKRFGFQLALDDDDDGGERDAQVAWFGKLGDFAVRPASFGELLLGGP